jgi:hypothetical protein
MTEIDLLVKFTLTYKRAAALTRHLLQHRLNFIWLILLNYVKMVPQYAGTNHRMTPRVEHAKNHGKTVLTDAVKRRF